MDSLALPSEWVDLHRQLEPLSSQQLRTELAWRLGLTASNLLRLAVIVHILEARGDDLSAFNGGLMDILRRIALGELLPELVVMFSGEPDKIKRAGKLPLAAQQEIVAGRKPMPAKPDRYQYRPKPRGRVAAPAPSTARPNPFHQMATTGLPRDVGETAAEMVLASTDPQTAVEFLMMKLQRNGLVTALREPELAS